MLSIRVGGDTIEARLTALDTAVDGPLGDDPTGRSRDDLVEFFQRFETVLRAAAAIGHRLIVETTERLIPGHLGCRSVGDFLIGTLRISGADATRRVKGAKKAGTQPSLDGEEVEPELPATAAAVKTGAIGPDHVAAVAKILRKVPHGVGFDEITVAEKILADAACSATPEDVTKLGAHLLAHLNPDGDVPDEKERRRRRGLRIGTQGTDRMTPISGLLDPETRALLEPVLAKLARPGMNNPDDPDSPRGDVESDSLDRDALAKAAARDTRTVVQRNHDALKVALRQLLSSGVLGSHRGLPVTAILTMTVQQLEDETGIVTTAPATLTAVHHITEMTPVRRNGTPDDVAAACAFLCSDDVGFITGRIIGVSGGWYLQGRAGANGTIRAKLLDPSPSVPKSDAPSIFPTSSNTYCPAGGEREHMCTRVIWPNAAGAVLVGRNMDYHRDTGTNLWSLPRGIDRRDGVGGSLSWTSKFGSVVAGAFDMMTVDGMNEAGLSGHILWLAESDYGTHDPSRPALSMAVWMQYFLDNFATVDEATAWIQQTDVQVVPLGDPTTGEVPAVHLALDDATGDSAIIEYVDGKVTVWHDRSYHVMTNSPTYDKQLELLRDIEGFGGDRPLPGTTVAADRFARAAYYVGRLPEPKSQVEAIAGMFSVIRNAAQPFRIPDPDKPNASQTIWQTVGDLTNKRYVFASTTRPNVLWVNLAELDFSEGAPARKLDLLGDTTLEGGLGGNVTDRFVETAPLRFLELPAAQ